MHVAVQLCVALLVMFVLPVAQAHESRPGFLELRQIGAENYSLMWKKPSGGEVEIALAPVFPPECKVVNASRQDYVTDALVLRGQLQCKGGLGGKRIEIKGIETTISDVLIRLIDKQGKLESHILRPSEPGVTLGQTTTAWQRAGGYLQLGLQHILLGADHLLFVFGLLLIVGTSWMLLKTITAFTVAHSLTLALATLGYVNAPMPPLNAAIALSILFLAIEIARKWQGQDSLTLRQPWLVAFAFGLLHGFGFATGLSAMGLPQAEIAQALLLFNVGVEIGQLAFVALVCLLVRAFRMLEIRWSPMVLRLPGYLIGSLGAFWTLQRSLILLGVIR